MHPSPTGEVRSQKKKKGYLSWCFSLSAHGRQQALHLRAFPPPPPRRFPAPPLPRSSSAHPPQTLPPLSGVEGGGKGPGFETRE